MSSINRLAPFTPFVLDAEPASMRPRARTRREAFSCALQGLREAWRTQPNLRLHGYAAIGVTALGLWTHLAVIEWLWVSFAIGLVLFAELMNTAIEQTIDLVVGLQHDPFARQAKDIAAGCVLVAAILAAVIGALTFAPHFLKG